MEINHRFRKREKNNFFVFQMLINNDRNFEISTKLLYHIV